jgi:sigma-B regulation protein RsbU (phosphoserine phosphatase)
VRILVVDDDPAIRILLAAKLATWGHTIATAGNGAEAWQMLSAEAFDVLVSDWNMPVMDGLELCRRVRCAQRPSYIYIILCTAMSQKADFLIGMEAGADDFVVKPVDFAELHVRIRAAQRILDLQTKLEDQNASLRDLYDKLNNAYQTISRDLEAASAMQLRLLPKKTDNNHLVNLDWLMIPSHFLAGDMLNYFMADANTLAFYHLDVAGHGIPAALLSVTLNRLLIPIAGSPIVTSTNGYGSQSIVPPAEVVAELNRRFQSDGDVYFTMVYGLLNTVSRRLTFCQAGHPGPVVLSKSGRTTLLGSGGFPVGMMPDMEYEEVSAQLEPGDRLILYSDGVPECQSVDGERYTEERLFATLTENCGEPLSGLIQGVRDDVSSWRGQGKFNDDISLLALECCQ